MRSYMSLATAKKAIAAAGLAAMDVRYDNVTGSYRGAKKFQPVVLCDLLADKREVEDRGFRAELKHSRLDVGATVRLSDKIDRRGELAVVMSMPLDERNGRARLDRVIAGASYWPVSDLVVITPDVE